MSFSVILPWSKQREWLDKKQQCCSGFNLAAMEKQQTAWITQQGWPDAWIQARPSYLITVREKEREPCLAEFIMLSMPFTAADFCEVGFQFSVSENILSLQNRC